MQPDTKCSLEKTDILAERDINNGFSLAIKSQTKLYFVLNN